LDVLTPCLNNLGTKREASIENITENIISQNSVISKRPMQKHNKFALLKAVSKMKFGIGLFRAFIISPKSNFKQKSGSTLKNVISRRELQQMESKWQFLSPFFSFFAVLEKKQEHSD
jgi:hypothetical protein